MIILNQFLILNKPTINLEKEIQKTKTRKTKAKKRK
jgi:hypothetical protein